jgi:hypothetical protein
VPAAGVVVLTVIAWRRRAAAVASLGILATCGVALGLAGLGPQQVVFPIAFAVYAVVIRRTSWLRGSAGWLRRGLMSGRILILAAGIAAIASAALLAWYAVVRPDLADLVRTFVPNEPLWLLLPGALVFALLNAAIEEAAYRGVVLWALDAVLGPTAANVIAQAAAFATLHVHGLPRGAIGVGMAFVYGLALGALCRKTGGLLAPWIAHVLTDVAVAALVLALARG